MYALISQAPPLLRGRRGTICTAKGSDVRPGVPRALPLLRGRRGTMCIAKGSDIGFGRHGTYIHVFFCVTRVGPITYSHTHALTHSLTHIHHHHHHHHQHVPAMFTVYQPQGMQKEFIKYAAALEECTTLFGQRKYGEDTIVLIVCRKKVRAWSNTMKGKQLTHKELTLRTHIHRYLNA